MSNPQFHIGIKVPEVTNASGNEKVCELYFTNTIQNGVNYWTGDDISLLRDCIDKINAEKPTHIKQFIDSWGGSAPVGLGIYNYLKDKTTHKAKKVSTKILNNCASIASVMSCAGDVGEITMPRNGMMVIHRAMNSAAGTADELRAAANLADKYTEQVLDVYVQNNRKGKTRDDLYNLIKDGDYWMTGTEAKEMGFVDDCYNDESITITNSIATAKALGYDGDIPQRILALAAAETPNEEIPQGHKNFFQTLINKIDMKIDSIIAGIKPQITAAIPTADGQAKMETLLNDMLTAVNTGVAADIEAAVTNATNAFTEATAAVKAEYKEVLDSLTIKVTNLTTLTEKLVADVTKAEETITAQKTTITAQEKAIKDLKADVEATAGRPTPAQGEPAVHAGVNARKTFAGKTSAYSAQ